MRANMVEDCEGCDSRVWGRHDERSWGDCQVEMKKNMLNGQWLMDLEGSLKYTGRSQIRSTEYVINSPGYSLEASYKTLDQIRFLIPLTTLTWICSDRPRAYELLSFQSRIYVVMTQ